MARNFGVSTYNEVIPGIISAVSSFSVCLTYAMFPELRSLRYVELVFYVAINDLIASIGMALGYTENGSDACWFQGISTNFNFLSAILWTTIISFQVWLVVCKQNVIKDLTYAHLICWGIPLLATLLPLTTSTYANPDDESNWCFVAKTSDSPDWSQLFWFIFAFYGWIWLAMICNVVFISGILYRFYQMQEVPERVVGTIRKLLLYPIVIVFCWSIITFTDLYSTIHTESKTTGFYLVDGIATILAVSQGFFFALVFFGLNPLIRKAWLDFFKTIGIVRPEKEEEPRDRDDKSVSMVSVSMNGTSSDGNASRDTRIRDERDARRSSTGGFLRSSITSMNSWYMQPKDSVRVQEEFDFIPTEGESHLVQRLSLLAFMTSGVGENSITERSTFYASPRASELTPAARSLHGNMELSLTSNPLMAVSVAVDDFASVTTATAAGRNTPHSLDQDDSGGEYAFHDEETGSIQSGLTHSTMLTASTARGGARALSESSTSCS